MKQFKSYSFYIRTDTPYLYLRLNLGEANKKKSFSTLLKLDDCRFDVNKQKFLGSGELVDKKNTTIGKMVLALNTFSGTNSALMTKIQAIGQDLNINSTNPSFTLLDAIQENMRYKQLKPRPSSLSRITLFESALSTLSPFFSLNDLDIEAYDLLSATDRADRQMRLNYINDYFQNLHQFLIDKKLKPSTQKQYFEVIKNSIKYISNKYGFVIPCEFDQIQIVRSEPVAMNASQAYKFLNSSTSFKSDDMAFAFATAKLQILVPSLRAMDALQMKEDQFDYTEGESIVSVRKIVGKTQKRGVGFIPMALHAELKGFNFSPPWKHIKRNRWTNKYNKELQKILSYFKDIYNEPVYITKQDATGGVTEIKSILGKEFTSHNLVKTGINYWESVLAQKGVLNVEQVMDIISAKTKEVREKHYSNRFLNTSLDKVSSIVGEIMGN